MKRVVSQIRHRALRLPLGAALATACTLVLSSTAALADQPPQPIDDDAIHPITVSFGGADPLPTSRTVQHWLGETTNPENGITYRYNMVGVDPSTDGSATVGVDIIPLDVTVDGVAFNGSDRVAGVIGSPLFQSNIDYSSTRALTHANGTPWFRPAPLSQFPLSANNTGQLIDATMRSQFNKVGSGYHLVLDTGVLYDPVTIDVPREHGITVVTPGNVVFADVDVSWFQARVQNLLARLHLDPTHLTILLTKDVLLYVDNDPLHCCVLGAHGAGHATGGENGPVNGMGNQPVQTFVWSSWLSPGLFGPRMWINKDISVLTHEITEWAADPFNTNTVQRWKADNAPQYGCSDLLEVGDPTFNLGFAVGPFDATGEGTFHIQEEAFLPWFMHIAPNTISQRAQITADGRYTFMGDLNPFPWFHRPADTC
ncbi:MAG TPA: hypothetical protein VGA47_00190 [Candidatus Dormibacteraeota bacterium]